MNKKWFLMLVSLFLSTMIVVGCNNDEGDPAPPQEDTTEDDPSVEDPLEKANDLGEDAEQRSDAEENRDEKVEENFEESVDDLEEDPDTNVEK
jgi:hypothetical protein